MANPGGNLQRKKQKFVAGRGTREMLAANMARSSTSPHGAPTFCVKKPDGWRIVHDYRAMNMNTVRRTMPMPRKDVILEKMQGSYYFSCLDLLSGYYQFRMREDGIPYTSFQTPDGLFEYVVSYFDDIYVYTKSRNIQHHLDALDRVFSRLHEHQFYIKLSKCVFCAPEIPCLGDIVERDGVRISPAKMKVIQEWPLPKTKNQLQSFLGTATYVQRFCKNFAIDDGPMFNLLKRSDKQVPWTDELRQHFESLKTTISQTPKFYLWMDASDSAMGDVLFQKQFRDGKEIERPIAFAGRKYKAAEVNYSVCEKELLAILFGLRNWRVYRLDRPLCVETDHKSLETVFKQKIISRRIARWFDELADYSFDIKYVRGADNGVADGVSRRPDFAVFWGSSRSSQQLFVPKEVESRNT
ncbi:Retroelement [Phytophthora megakarya]|uniref:Retroelement n=1 Tax=Phytophthora megakarya TaxID=4795 RepID=A0A225VX01_9STRA|nr:Retroelement [Phytophthora megakarya]